MNSKKTIKGAFEAMMYIWGEPLDVKTAAEVCNIDRREAMELFLELKNEYDSEKRGIFIRQTGNSFQFATRPEYAEFIEKLCTPVKTRRLTQAALEVLAIVAYRQPATKSEVDYIRGVKCDRVIDGLVDKDLIKEVGRSEGIGRPILYGTTETFLKQFGFASIKELPDMYDPEGVFVSEDEDTGKQITMDEICTLREEDE